MGIVRDRDAKWTHYLRRPRIPATAMDGISAIRCERHGPFRLAILPIGACEPRWFNADQHMKFLGPVGAGIDRLRRRDCARPPLRHVPTDREPIDAPLVALADALKVAGISPERFRALRPGQVWQL